MPNPMWRDSSSRMRLQIASSTGSRALSLIILNRATAKVSATSCSAIVLRYQRLSDRIESKRSRSFAGIG